MSHERDSLERAILCACLQDPDTIGALQPVATQRDFSDRRHVVLYRAMLALHIKGRGTDPLTVSAFLREHGVTDRIGGVEYIGDILGEVVVPLPLAPRALDWLASLRDLNKAATDVHGTAQRAQLATARIIMARESSSIMTYPLPTLANLRGGWSAGEVDFLASASGGGKTTMLSTLSRRWVAAGRKVFYAGFELPAHQLRLQWAAHDAGYLPGDIVSGEYLGWPNVDDVKARMAIAIQAQEERVNLLRCTDVSFVSVKSLRQMADEALEWGADVFIVDHIDHIEGTGDLHGQSRQVTSAILEIAKTDGLRFLVATQLNQQGLGLDPLRSHRPVREEHIKQGGHKKEISTFFLGLSRAIRKNVTKEELKAVRNRMAEVRTIEESFAAQVNVMKHRHYGERVGKVKMLGWERGEYTEYVSEEERKPTRVVQLRNDVKPVPQQDLRLMAQ